MMPSSERKKGGQISPLLNALNNSQNSNTSNNNNNSNNNNGINVFSPSFPVFSLPKSKSFPEEEPNLPSLTPSLTTTTTTTTNNNTLVHIIPPLDSMMISDDPNHFGSHFQQLSKPNRKGQARYRCLQCDHEFTCAGKTRRIQHILGMDLCLAKDRNISCCKNPYLPLKRNLFIHFSKIKREQEERERQQQQQLQQSMSDEGNQEEEHFNHQEEEEEVKEKVLFSKPQPKRKRKASFKEQQQAPVVIKDEPEIIPTSRPRLVTMDSSPSSLSSNASPSFLPSSTAISSHLMMETVPKTVQQKQQPILKSQSLEQIDLSFLMEMPANGGNSVSLSPFFRSPMANSTGQYQQLTTGNKTSDPLPTSYSFQDIEELQQEDAEFRELLSSILEPELPTNLQEKETKPKRIRMKRNNDSMATEETMKQFPPKKRVKFQMVSTDEKPNSQGDQILTLNSSNLTFPQYSELAPITSSLPTQLSGSSLVLSLPPSFQNQPTYTSLLYPSTALDTTKNN